MSLRVHHIFRPMATTHLIESESGLVLIDAGLPGHERHVLRRMQSLGRDDLVLIFITHAHLDHYGSAATLRRLTGAPIAIHRADGETMAQGKTPIRSARNRGRLVLPFMPLIEAIVRLEPTPPDVTLDDGDNLRSQGIDLDFEAVVLHTPGHTPGSSCLIIEGRLAFVGDLISTAPRTTVQKFFADDWSLIPESLARLQALRPEWVYSGHGYRPLSGEKVQRLTCRG
jgi:glyoxylase-like metal-dependent hydrolase (beta-lactamase superfamily II)